MPDAPPVTDAQLVGRARQGDADAFEALVRRHYRAAYAVALAVLENEADAEDACQEVFLTVLEQLDDCREAEKFAAWLLQIARNHARNRWRYLRIRHAAQLESDWPTARENPARDAERAELRATLVDALKALSASQRQVVLLHDLEGRSHREIGDSLGISELMSRQHLFVARRKLRHRLGPGAVREALGE